MQEKVGKKNSHNLKTFPENCNYYATTGDMNVIHETLHLSTFSECATHSKDHGCYSLLGTAIPLFLYTNHVLVSILLHQQLCDFVILQENTNLTVKKIPDNGKENVLIYAGNLKNNA